MAAGRKTGGRKKGSVNKVTRNRLSKVESAALDAGEQPIEYMLRVMRDRSVEHDRRDRMAAAAAPFIHPRLATTSVDLNGTGNFNFTVVTGIGRAPNEPAND